MLLFKVDPHSPFHAPSEAENQGLFQLLELRIKEFLSLNTGRSSSLFCKFLPQGYLMTTLDCVPSERVDRVICAKVFLGMIITLYDDLADHPRLRNPLLLSALYQINLGRKFSISTHLNLNEQEIRTYEFAGSLFECLDRALEGLPHYEALKRVLSFDIEMFYCCNRYSEMLSIVPGLGNLSEVRTLGPHNMGIVAAGMIDLMACHTLNLQELGRCREVLLLGQRLGRISNLIFTLERELTQGDVTNEILYLQEGASEALLKEFDKTVELILEVSLKSFGTAAYAQGLKGLHKLHDAYKGQI